MNPLEGQNQASASAVPVVPQVPVAPIEAPIVETITPPSEPVPKKSHKKLFMIIGVIVLLLILAAVGVFAFTKMQTPKMYEDENFPTPTPAVVDEMSGWKNYEGQSLAFKYPSSWTATEGSVEYFGGETVIIKNEEESVTLTVYPAIDNRFPYGFGKPELQKKTINVAFNGKDYVIEEITVDNKALYAEMINDGEYSFMFGTGYPSGDDQLASLDDYYRDQDTLLQILSTFEFVDSSIAEEIKTADLVSTTGWENKSVEGLTLMLPQGATIREGVCTGSYEDCYIIEKHDSSLLAPPHITLKIKAYNGGSRREEASLELPLSNYSFAEKMYGSNMAIDATNICSISSCTSLRAIILVVSNKLVFVQDGVYKSGSTTTLESPITNTIISTIK